MSRVTQVTNYLLGFALFCLLRPTALSEEGCPLELVRLCDILTVLVSLLNIFFSPLLVDEGKCGAVHTRGDGYGRGGV